MIFLFLTLIFILGLIYFLSMVCIQFSNMSNLKLQFGMDVTKLYLEDELEDDYINFYIKKCAMFLYKISNRV